MAICRSELQLDGGALGAIAPHIESAADAARVVRAAKFPPQGDRSIAGNLPHFGFRSLPNAEVAAALNDATMVMAMIESQKALDAVEEIAAVEGVDALFVGTNDLCGFRRRRDAELDAGKDRGCRHGASLEHDSGP